ncbi:MAG: thioredoxin [Bacteroidetes bacterium]|nr:thioredoxin [Bacteroidota bacterium]
MVLELTDTNFKSEILKANKVALVDFWAPWCGPCRMFAPTIDELAKDYDEKVIVGKVNIDNNAQLSSTYGIKTIPTIIIFKNGKAVETIQDSKPKSFFSEAIERHLL